MAKLTNSIATYQDCNNATTPLKCVVCSATTSGILDATDSYHFYLATTPSHTYANNQLVKWEDLCKAKAYITSTSASIAGTGETITLIFYAAELKNLATSETFIDNSSFDTTQYTSSGVTYGTITKGTDSYSIPVTIPANSGSSTRTFNFKFTYKDYTAVLSLTQDIGVTTVYYTVYTTDAEILAATTMPTVTFDTYGTVTCTKAGGKVSATLSMPDTTAPAYISNVKMNFSSFATTKDNYSLTVTHNYNSGDAKFTAQTISTCRETSYSATTVSVAQGGSSEITKTTASTATTAAAYTISGKTNCSVNPTSGTGGTTAENCVVTLTDATTSAETYFKQTDTGGKDATITVTPGANTYTVYITDAEAIAAAKAGTTVKATFGTYGSVNCSLNAAQTQLSATYTDYTASAPASISNVTMDYTGFAHTKDNYTLTVTNNYNSGDAVFTATVKSYCDEISYKCSTTSVTKNGSSEVTKTSATTTSNVAAAYTASAVTNCTTDKSSGTGGTAGEDFKVTLTDSTSSAVTYFKQTDTGGKDATVTVAPNANTYTVTLIDADAAAATTMPTATFGTYGTVTCTKTSDGKGITATYSDYSASAPASIDNVTINFTSFTPTYSAYTITADKTYNSGDSAFTVTAKSYCDKTTYKCSTSSVTKNGSVEVNKISDTTTSGSPAAYTASGVTNCSVSPTTGSGGTDGEVFTVTLTDSTASAETYFKQTDTGGKDVTVTVEPISTNIYVYYTDGAVYEASGSSLTSNIVTSGGAYSMDSVSAITLLDGVTSIAADACNGCTYLEKVNIATKNLSSIGNNAFYYCESLQNFVIPDSVTSLGTQVFYGDSALQSITLGSGLTNVCYQNTFSGATSVTSLTIRAQSISGSTSYSGGGASNGAFDTNNGCPFFTSLTIADTYTSTTIPDTAFYSQSYLQSIDLSNIPLTGIGQSAFYYCKDSTGLTLPDTLVNIGNEAFSENTALTGVTFPNTLDYIGGYAFHNDCSLTGITTPSSTTYIGEGAFLRCSGAESIHVKSSSNGTIIDKVAFGYCEQSTALTLDEGVTEIHDYAFEWNASLPNIYIPTTVKQVGINPWIFNKQLSAITVDTGNTWYTSRDASGNERDLIMNSAHTEVVTGGYHSRYREGESVNPSGDDVYIPNTVTSINQEAFEGNIVYCYGAAIVFIPDSVTHIYKEAFNQDTGLYFTYSYSGASESDSGVTCGNNLEYIGEEAFQSTENLHYIKFSDTVTEIEARAFYNSDLQRGLIFGTGIMNIEYSISNEAFCYCKIDTINSSQYVNLDNYDVIDNMVMDKSHDTILLGGTQSGLLYLTSPSDIYQHAFGGNHSEHVYNVDTTSTVNAGEIIASSYANFMVPDSVTGIGESAFHECTWGIYFDENNITTKKIEANAFYKSGIVKAVFNNDGSGNDTIELGSGAFQGSSLILLGFDVNNLILGVYCFEECQQLIGNADDITKLTIPVTVQLDYAAFQGCTKLSTVDFENNTMTSIPTKCFSGCSNLSTVNFTQVSKLTKIEDYAFTECKLKGINLSGWHVTTIGYAAFDGYNNKMNGMDSILPVSLTSIGDRAFYYARFDTYELQYEGTVDQWNNDVAKGDAAFSEAHENYDIVVCSDGAVNL